ncbi:MAG: L,D-transpeptidase family protein [Sphingobacteriaceae bacterium]|nr:L,D-transpeptidase family protein [Sphingobacteriaceae bacterium]
MKPHNKTQSTSERYFNKTILAIGFIIILLQLAFLFAVGANPIEQLYIQGKDSLRTELGKQLSDLEIQKRLNFPKTVKRFYDQVNLQTNWLRSEENSGPTDMAMRLLDCVKQYGLQPRDYHPEILTYEEMHRIFSSEIQLSAGQKIEFELMLTDAMVSIINNLHFGAYNPRLSKTAIDNGLKDELHAEIFLHLATGSGDLMQAVLTVQPKIDQYVQLQGYMKLIAGQYTCDSYETPEEDIRLIAINMERLRWLTVEANSYLHINIPSFELTYYTPFKISEYKVVVGKPSTPTPTLESAIGFLETGADWMVPQNIFIKELLPRVQRDLAYFENNHMAVYDLQENFVPITNQSLLLIRQNPRRYHLRQTSGCDNALGKVVFRFSNIYGIYLHDTPEQQYFGREKRAFSHGCVRVSDAEQLAISLIKNDQQGERIPLLKKALSSYSKQKFILKTPLPIIITYLTITVESELLVKHADIYSQDKALEGKMYGQQSELTKASTK